MTFYHPHPQYRECPTHTFSAYADWQRGERGFQAYLHQYLTHLVSFSIKLNVLVIRITLNGQININNA